MESETIKLDQEIINLLNALHIPTKVIRVNIIQDLKGNTPVRLDKDAIEQIRVIGNGIHNELGVIEKLIKQLNTVPGYETKHIASYNKKVAEFVKFARRQKKELELDIMQRIAREANKSQKSILQEFLNGVSNRD